MNWLRVMIKIGCDLSYLEREREEQCLVASLETTMVQSLLVEDPLVRANEDF